MWRKLFKTAFKCIFVSSELNETAGNSKNGLDGVNNNWGTYISAEDILTSYDTVIEVYSREPFFDFDEELLETHNACYNPLNDDAVVPDNHYSNPIQGIEDIRETLNGNTLLVAFEFDGKDLPNYSELETVNTEGNWWDHPEDLDTDILVDRKTYEGALKVPFNVESSRHVLTEGSEEVMHITQ